MNKQVCKACNTGKGFRWGEREEENWKQGQVFCPATRNSHLRVTYHHLTAIEKCDPPFSCFCHLEHLVLGQEP